MARNPQKPSGKPPASASPAKASQAPSSRLKNTPDALNPGQFRLLVQRVVLIAAGAWLFFGLISLLVTTTWIKVVTLAVPALITVLGVVIVVWSRAQAKKTSGIASILSKVESAADKKAAILELESNFKKNDPSVIFAKAQLALEEDPRKALSILEQIDLNKVLAPVADEARAQRAMIHLLLGEVPRARDLASGIDLSRHQDVKGRAMIAAVVSEAWARSGDAKKAVETLGLFNPEDAEYEQLRPQLYRAQAYAFAHSGDLKGMRRALTRLSKQDPRILAAFLAKKTHPLLQREAKKMVEQSGIVPRKVIMQRR